MLHTLIRFTICYELGSEREKCRGFDRTPQEMRIPNKKVAKLTISYVETVLGVLRTCNLVGVRNRTDSSCEEGN